MLSLFSGSPSLDLAPVAPNTSPQMYFVYTDNVSTKLFVDTFTVTLLNDLVLIIFLHLL